MKKMMRLYKKKGQHLLKDLNIARREVEYADLSNKDIVLEIGPGNGVLTRLLAKKAKKVIAVEIDERFIKLLKDRLPKNVTLIHADILNLDFKNLPWFNKIVSNLPFNISSEITFKVLEQKFDLAILMYQKEFAERMIAKPGSKKYSRLSVAVYYKSKCEILETVSREKFYPRPKVDCCIVKLVPRTKKPFKLYDEKLFENVTKILFMHRRKKIGKVLSSFYDKNLITNIPYLDRRVDSLSPGQIGEIANKLYNSLC